MFSCFHLLFTVCVKNDSTNVVDLSRICPVLVEKKFTELVLDYESQSKNHFSKTKLFNVQLKIPKQKKTQNHCVYLLSACLHFQQSFQCFCAETLENVSFSRSLDCFATLTPLQTHLSNSTQIETEGVTLILIEGGKNPFPS